MDTATAPVVASRSQATIKSWPLGYDALTP